MNARLLSRAISGGEWKYGYFSMYNGQYVLVSPYGSQSQYIDEIDDPETICSSTGLTDKYAKEIFENDIVRVGARKYVIKWNHECAGFQLFRDNTWYGSLNSYYMGVEVVGNLFEWDGCLD